MKLRLILIFAFLFLQINCSKWVSGKKDTVTTFIYVPELFSTELQMSKYCPSFIASTGKCVTCSHGIEVLKEPVSTCNFAELNLEPGAYAFLNYVNPLNWVSGTLKQIVTMVALYQNLQPVLSIKLGFNSDLNSDLTLLKKFINFSKLNFGQEADIKILSNLYERHILNIKNEYPKFKNEIVLFGVSRGAATALNFIAQNEAPEIKAIICESIFDSIPSLLEYRFPFLKKVALKCVETFTMFKKDGPSPIANVEKIPDVPILLITSLKDEIVPFQCSFNLYKSLKNSGHKNTYLLILKNSTHLGYGDPEDKKLYENTVHAFYKKFNLPFIKALADNEPNFEQIVSSDFNL